MAEHPYSYIFRCSSKTEKECFDRMLFGEKERFLTDFVTLKKGDVVFLYNIDTELLMGNFVALTDIGENIEKEAWKGEFPCQVKVKRMGAPLPLSKKNIDMLIKFRYSYGKYYPDTRIDRTTLNNITRLFKSTKRETFSIVKKKKLEPPRIKTYDGHLVRSEWEKNVCDWLRKNKIQYDYEKRVNIDESVVSDFFISTSSENETEGVYIELWGKTTKTYLGRQKKKVDLYKKYNLNLIEIFPEDLGNLDKTLLPKLQKFGIGKKLI